MSLVTAVLVLVLARRPVDIFPRPSRVDVFGDPWAVRAATITASGDAASETAEAKDVLREANVKPGPGATLTLTVAAGIKGGPEAYRLQTKPGHIAVTGASPHGVFNGLQTLRQLFAFHGKTPTLPSVSIDDAPRFRWRGYMLDDSRHFFTEKEIVHLLGLLARYKVNTFHWHLSDDGGWRVEIKRHPELTDIGAYRLPANRVYETKDLSFPTPRPVDAYGGFYTQVQIRRIVAYAASKHITIVPEFDMPGHSLAMTSSNPKLLCTPTSQAGFQKEEGWQLPNILCPGKESTFKYVDEILDEVMALFPSKIIHIGGDEVDKYTWTRCDDCRRRMETEHLKNPAELESYFIARIEKYLNAHGRSIIGWDEIMEGGLTPTARVMSWRGVDGGIQAARHGHEVVMTPLEACYINSPQSELTLDMMYKFDPTDGLPASAAKYVIGGETCLWTEGVFDIATVDAHSFPRVLVMAENLWSTLKDPFDTFLARLNRSMGRIAALCPNLYIPAPATPAAIVGPGDTVAFAAPEVPGWTIRYESDGRVPTAHSAIYRSPLTSAEGQTIVARIFNGPRGGEETAQVACRRLNHFTVADAKPGLVSQAFHGEFHRVPRFNEFKAASSTVMERISEAEPNNDGSYAQLLTGYFHAERAGVYRFRLGADDGAVLWLDGTKLVDDDGEHSYREVQTGIRLAKGDYPIRVGYFNAMGGTKLRLYISFGAEPFHEASGAELVHN